MAVIIAVAIFLIALFLLVLVLWFLLIQPKNMYGRPDPKNVMHNKSGMNVRKDYTGGGKGDDFEVTDQMARTILSRVGNTPAPLGFWILELVKYPGKESLTSAFRKKLYIGRDGQMDGRYWISVPEDLKMSRKHCVIFEEDGQLYLYDCGSRNHTFFNGAMVEGPVQITKGSEIRAGRTKFRVRDIRRG